MAHITVSDIKIDVVRKDIKNIHLAVYPPTGRVRIAAPLRVNEDAIRLFAVSKLGWIKRRQREFEGQERLSRREYKNRESHYFQGKRYLLNVIDADVPPKVVLRSKTYLDLYIRHETPNAKRQVIMSEWYRAQLKKQIPELIKKWEEKLNVTDVEWQVKLMKTKWGSCTAEKKRIWINLELAKKPVHCLEYVIVHEMMHLLERRHNERFIAFMDKHLPKWRFFRDELNRGPLRHENWSY